MEGKKKEGNGTFKGRSPSLLTPTADINERAGERLHSHTTNWVGLAVPNEVNGARKNGKGKEGTPVILVDSARPRDERRD